jgi:hypothetical protein
MRRLSGSFFFCVPKLVGGPVAVSRFPGTKNAEPRKPQALVHYAVFFVDRLIYCDILLYIIILYSIFSLRSFV